MKPERYYFVVFASTLMILCLVGCTAMPIYSEPSDSVHNSEPTQYILVDNPMFQEIQTQIGRIVVKDRFSGGIVCLIEDPQDVMFLLSTFNGWHPQEAVTESRDVICNYEIYFGEAVQLQHSGSSDGYCRMDNQSYLLPSAFCAHIRPYISWWENAEHDLSATGEH